MKNELAERLRESGIRPSAQRLAVAAVVLTTQAHPSAEEVHRRVHDDLPTVSLATVYNTLHLLVERGLLREVRLDGDRVLYDRNTSEHHHLVNAASGEVHDLPASTLQVEGLANLASWEVESVHVIVRARRREGRGGPARTHEKGGRFGDAIEM